MAAQLQMTTESGLLRGSAKATLILALITLLGVSGLFWRNAIMDTPIYASDEYAYLIAGKFYNHRPAVFQDDPGLQRVPNVLYFRIVNAVFRTTRNGWESLRVMNVILYGLVGLGFTAVAYRMTTRAMAGGFLLLYFLLPWSGYTASIQPEITAYFAVSLVAIAAILAVRLSSLVLCIAAGVLAAGSYYIKPSVVGIAIGTAFFLLLYFGRNQSRKRRLLFPALACSGFLISLYLGLLIWKWVAGESWTWIPDFMSGLYGDELRKPTGGVWATVATCATYCVGHITVLLIMFPLGIAAIVYTIRAGRTAFNDASDNSWVSLTLARWLVWVLFASLVAVSYYSVKAGGISDFGARLHGRYLGFAFPYFLLFSLLFLHRMFTEHDPAPSKQRWIRLSSYSCSLGCCFGNCSRNAISEFIPGTTLN